MLTLVLLGAKEGARGKGKWRPSVVREELLGMK